MIGVRSTGKLPWNKLSGALADSLDLKCLVLATLGLLLMHLGQLGWNQVSTNPPEPVREVVAIESGPGAMSRPWLTPAPAVQAAAQRVAEPYRLVLSSWGRLLRLGGGNAAWFVHAAQALALTILWSLFGGAIARIAVVRAADASEAVGLLPSIRFSVRHAWALLAGPLGSLLMVVAFVAFGALFGLLFRSVGGFLGTVGEILAFLPMLAGICLAILLIGLAASWPLMILTVAAEGEDGFDAVSRSFSYVGHRTGHYVVGTVFLFGLGLLGAMLVSMGGQFAMHLGRWLVAFGAPESVAADLFRPQAGTSSLLANGRIWGQVLAAVVSAWSFSYFWCAMARLYLWLRLAVDGAPWHDVYLPSRESSSEVFASSDVPAGSDEPAAN